METQKNWKEIHSKQKELRKKWKKEKTIKQLDKEKEEKQIEDAVLTNLSTDHSSSSEIPSTVSIAIPGSILDNAQSPELRSYLAGQIARAACVYKIDEVVIFDDYGNTGPKNSKVTQYGEFAMYIKKQ